MTSAKDDLVTQLQCHVPSPSLPPDPNVESLLVFSDVHLGSDLNDHTKSPKRSARIDQDLVAFLTHYTSAPAPKGRWRMVIAGDFIDFIGMTVEPDEVPLSTELDEEERAHGLGNARDHARAKLRRVAKRHEDVFAALAEFLARGHALTVVHGNHDVEFHWDEVKNDLRAILLAHARRARPDADEADFLARIDFNVWFFYWKGVAYIEHGHQYDPYCATENAMAPLSPLDPRRIARGFSDILLRYVVRPTRGMFEHGHENLGLPDYVRFGLRLGARGGWDLLMRFARAVIELFRLRRSYFTEAAGALRAEHERRMELLAEATRIGVERIRALAALQSPPVTRSIRGILASVLLDRLALGLLATILLVLTALLGAWRGQFLVASALVAVAWPFAHWQLARLRRIDPAEEMEGRAHHLARLLPAALVVMGHTHTPMHKPIADGAATYINLGAWAEDEPAPGAHGAEAPRTHLVIHIEAGQPVADLRIWEPSGPRHFGGA